MNQVAGLPCDERKALLNTLKETIDRSETELQNVETSGLEHHNDRFSGVPGPSDCWVCELVNDSRWNLVYCFL